MRFAQFRFVDSVMFRYSTVYAEQNRLLFARQIRDAKRPFYALQVDIRDVNNFRHSGIVP